MLQTLTGLLTRDRRSEAKTHRLTPVTLGDVSSSDAFPFPGKLAAQRLQHVREPVPSAAMSNLCEAPDGSKPLVAESVATETTGPNEE